MAGLKKRNGRRKKDAARRRRAAVFSVAALLLIFALGYLYRERIFAYGSSGNFTAPGDENRPPVAEEYPAEPEPPEEEPAEATPNEPLLPGDPYILIPVTKQTNLGDYKPDDLEQIPAELVRPEQRQYEYFLRKEVLAQLLLLWEDARAAGMELYINSAFRSYNTQDQLFRDNASRYGEDVASKFSARPGQSEHQLGTAVDFNSPGYYLTKAFGGAPEGCWLAENAHRYGFAMSYPADSQHITGYDYEPWHFRYIGVEAARRWKESGLVLCQFLEQLNESGGRFF